MKQRVSFYRKAEVVGGRAPRYMEDVEADSKSEAALVITNREGGKKAVVIRSVYKAPDFPIRKKPSFVFLTEEARNKWYSSHKSTQKERVCHECKKNEVERYKRICDDCRDKRKSVTEKPCAICKQSIPTPSRRRYCDDCAAKRKESQEKFHREKRAKQTTIDRIKEQVAWAEEKLKTTTKQSCKLASRFQGLRVPHITEDANGENPNRCRACLQKFIDVQTVYLANLLVGEQDENEFINAILGTEKEHAHGAAAGA